MRLARQLPLTKPVNVRILVDKLLHHISRREPDPFRIMIVDDEELLAQSYTIAFIKPA